MSTLTVKILKHLRIELLSFHIYNQICISFYWKGKLKWKLEPLFQRCSKRSFRYIKLKLELYLAHGQLPVWQPNGHLTAFKALYWNKKLESQDTFSLIDTWGFLISLYFAESKRHVHSKSLMKFSPGSRVTAVIRCENHCSRVAAIPLNHTLYYSPLLKCKLKTDYLHPTRLCLFSPYSTGLFLVFVFEKSVYCHDLERVNKTQRKERRLCI